MNLTQINIITSSSDAPFGFVEDTFTVSINGNTAEIQVEIKPVQGLDFIFINFTLGKYYSTGIINEDNRLGQDSFQIQWKVKTILANQARKC